MCVFVIDCLVLKEGITPNYLSFFKSSCCYIFKVVNVIDLGSTMA